MASMGRNVLAGPFRGMTYPQWTVDRRDIVSKLIGSYEDELTQWIESLSQKNYGTILNVGAADGYYSAGFGLRSPGSSIIAFDTDSWAREATYRIAKENSIENVEILRMCTPKWLASNLKADSLLMVDCEGYESVLLDTSVTKALKDCDILVELHEHVVPGLEKMIRGWYEDSHMISEILSRKKRTDEYKEFMCVSEESFERSIDEGRRMSQKWLLIQRQT